MITKDSVSFFDKLTAEEVEEANKHIALCESIAREDALRDALLTAKEALENLFDD